jgi:SAM-dependent methyltransferase
MERLKVGVGDPYDPIEASLHVGRYALALPFAGGRRVLDVACGEGYGSWLLADGGAAEVVGVDISSDAIRKARATFREDRLRFETSAGESLAQVLPLAHFDLIVSLETIEHVADPEAFLLALRQVATPDAIFVLTCPNDHWYYGDREGNPHHLRRLTSDQFKSLTSEFLGNNVQWLLGSATLGFAAVSADQIWRNQATRSKYTQVFPSRLTLRVPSRENGPSASNSSYFIGVWNAPEPIDGAGAFHALPMDDYSKMMWTATSMEQLADLKTQAAALGSQCDQLNREIAASRIEQDSLSHERDTLRADLAGLKTDCDAKANALAKEIREKEILGVQAAALRRENEIVSSQLPALRVALDAAQRQQADLQALLNNERAVMAAEVAALGSERDTLRADLAGLKTDYDAKANALAKEIREKEILGVQAAALRRENEIVSSQLPALRVALDAAQRQQADLQALLNNERAVMAAEVAALGGERDALRASLDWHIARVISLDEALNWHVARIQTFESEGPMRLFKRALGRTVQACPPLARLVSRLRRHSATQAENH